VRPRGGPTAPTNDTADREIVLSRVVDAPRERVFDVWLDSEHVGRWWGPNGFRTTTHALDPRPGGVWRFTMHGPDGIDYENRIVYLDIERPERLVYRHGGEAGTEDVRFHTTVTFAAEGTQTRVTLRSLFESTEERDRVVVKYGAVEGGEQTLARLAAYVAGRGGMTAP
jgi:uncharacterized protein YndB with AHSA1/START domain